MKRISILLCIVVCLLLCACGKTAPVPEESKTAAAETESKETERQEQTDIGQETQGGPNAETEPKEPTVEEDKSPEERVAEAVAAQDTNAKITHIMKINDKMPEYYGDELYVLLPAGQYLFAEQLPDVLKNRAAGLEEGNVHQTEGYLVFLSDETIPTYFVEQDTNRVLLTRSGWYDYQHWVQAFVSQEIADAYVELLNAINEQYGQHNSDLFSRRFYINGTVLELNTEANCLLMEGSGFRGGETIEGVFKVEYADSEESQIRGDQAWFNCFNATDLGMEQTDSLVDTFYSHDRAGALGIGTIPGEYNFHLSRYQKILENASPLTGVEYALPMGGYTICFTVPAEWTKECDVRLSDRSVSFFHKASLDCGGFLFSINLTTDEEFRIYPGAQEIVSDCGTFVYTNEPTDVQFSEAGMEAYMAMSAQKQAVADTIRLKSVP